MSPERSRASTEVDTRPRIELPSLTSLRWLAASLVFLHHWRLGPVWLYEAGSSGVSFFFILSGFILVWSARGPVAPRRFYRRRFARIFPAEVVSTAFYIVVALAIGRISSKRDLALTFFTLTQLQVWVPIREVFYAGNLVVWSLADEAFFYALFPFLLLRLRVLGARRVAQVAALAVVVSIAVPLLVRPETRQEFGYWFVYVNPVYRLAEFVLGMCLALLLVRGVLPRVHALLWALLAVAAYVVAGLLPLYMSYVALTLVPYALVIVACAQLDLDGRTPRPLGAPMALVLGRWSFAFYLLHFTVIKAFLYRFDVFEASPGAQFAIVVASYLVSTVGAALLYRLVEQPAERWLRPSGPG